jgi:transcriptional regulator NrdR family protein
MLELRMSVICKKCGEVGRVIDTRRHGETMWRRRECCGERWTTIEGGNSHEEVKSLRASVEKYRNMIGGVRAALAGKE